MSYCLDLPNGFSIVGNWLHDWQTLISGLLALGAAFWAGQKIQKQIQQVENFNQDQARRRLNGGRVRLPTALSDLMRYCQTSATSIAEIIESMGHKDDEHEGFVILRGDPELAECEYPAHGSQTLAAFVECLDHRDEEKHVAELLASLQIYAARFQTQRHAKPYVEDALIGLLLDCGKVKFLAEAMFNYARFAEDDSFAKVGTLGNEEAWRAVQQSTLGLVFDRPVIDGFGKAIGDKVNRYIELDTSPWIEKFVI